MDYVIADHELLDLTFYPNRGNWFVKPQRKCFMAQETSYCPEGNSGLRPKPSDSGNGRRKSDKIMEDKIITPGLTERPPLSDDFVIFLCPGQPYYSPSPFHLGTNLCVFAEHDEKLGHRGLPRKNYDALSPCRQPKIVLKPN